MPTRIPYGSSILILPWLVHQDLSWDHFNLGFPATIHYPFHFSPKCAKCPAHAIFVYFIIYYSGNLQSLSTNTCAEALGLLPLLLKLLQQELTLNSHM